MAAVASVHTTHMCGITPPRAESRPHVRNHAPTYTRPHYRCVCTLAHANSHASVSLLMTKWQEGRGSDFPDGTFSVNSPRILMQAGG